MNEIKKYLRDKKINDKDNDFLKIKDILNPNFGNLKTYCKFHFEYKVSHKRLQDFHNLCKSYSQLINNHKINISDYNSFEEVDDKINSIILENDNRKFAYKFISNKYKFLMDDEVIRLFGELRSIDNSHQRIQALLTSKLAAYKTIEDFKEAINKVINSFKGKFDPDTIEIEVIEAGGIVLFKDDKYLICETPTFQSCKKLGSSSWCIARSPGYFRQYAGATGKQHILYDFNYDRSHSKAKIGVSTDIMGRITHSYDNHDNYCEYGHTTYKTGYVYKAMSKESCLKRIEDGHRFSESVYIQIGITYDEIINIDKNYFLKLNEIDTTNIEDVIKYVQKRSRLRQKDLTYTYLELAGDDKDLLFKLLDAKFVYTEILFEYLKGDIVALKEYIRRFGDKIPKEIKLEKYLSGDNIFEHQLRNSKLSAYMIYSLVKEFQNKKNTREYILTKIFSLNIETDYFYIFNQFYFNGIKDKYHYIELYGFTDYLFKGTGLANHINNLKYNCSTYTLDIIFNNFPNELENYVMKYKLNSHGLMYYLDVIKNISDVIFNKYKYSLSYSDYCKYYSEVIKKDPFTIENIKEVFSRMDYHIILKLIQNQESDLITMCENDIFFKFLVKRLHKEGCLSTWGSTYYNTYHNFIKKIVVKHQKDVDELIEIIPKSHVDIIKNGRLI